MREQFDSLRVLATRLAQAGDEARIESERHAEVHGTESRLTFERGWLEGMARYVALQIDSCLDVLERSDRLGKALEHAAIDVAFSEEQLSIDLDEAIIAALADEDTAVINRGVLQ